MKKQKKRRGNSIKKKLMIPMTVMVIVQAMIFIVSIFAVDTVQQLRYNAYTHLDQIASSRKDTLENLMVHNWSRIENFRGILSESDRIYAQYAAQKEAGEEAGVDLTEELAQNLMEFMRSTSATGAFVIFNDKVEGTGNNPALYLRDLDPTNVASGTSDILVEYGPADLVKKLHLTMDYCWQPYLSLDPSNKQYQFYYQPLHAGKQYPQAAASDLGYWCPPFRMNPDDVDVVTYTIPLRDADNQVYGVAGVEITLDYLRSLLPYREIDDSQKSAYFLGIQMQGGSTMQNTVVCGPLFQRLSNDGTVSFGESVYKDLHYFQEEGGASSAIGARSTLKLYNTNTPFEKQQWVLFAVMDDADLLASAYQLENSLVIAFAVAVLVGVIGAALVSSYYSAPIKSLVSCLKKSRPDEPVSLPKVHITEIDQLASSVEKFSADVAESASRLSQVILATDMPLGAMEYDSESETVFCSGRALEVLDFPEELWLRRSFPRREFELQVGSVEGRMKLYQKMTSGNRKEMKERIVRLTTQKGEIKWINIKELARGSCVLVVIQDVSEEIREKMKMEYERDYDMLTRLLNRRSFKKQVIERLERKKPGVGAMVMWDLDNLKYINDTYGHDFGDKYIFEAARVFGGLNAHNALVARMSGDEFLAYLDGFSTEAELSALLKELHAQLHSTAFWLPDGNTVKLRASGGISWYPANGTSYEELVKGADYAMYSAKNNAKGEIREYEELSYLRDKVLFSGGEDLNRFLDHQLAKFAFQPIVSCKTGEVFAYEALMRPQCDGLRTVVDVMRIARAQSKLSRIEHLTWIGVMEAFQNQRSAFGTAKLFINSVPNTRLREEDLERLEEAYGEDIQRIVIEIIESEQTDETCMRHKKEIAGRWHAALALDDFGAGYSSESSLLSIEPQFVKIDMGIIRGIDHDVDRQRIVKSVLSYTQPRGVQVIAEGIETADELREVIELGVDYMQGYYLGMPDFEVKDISSSVKAMICSHHKK